MDPPSGPVKARDTCHVGFCISLQSTVTRESKSLVPMVDTEVSWLKKTSRYNHLNVLCFKFVVFAFQSLRGQFI